MNSLLVVLLALSMTDSHAKSHEHREHGAHVHGSAKLAIAFEQGQGKIEFRGAAEGVLGFEHKAKSAKDQKALAAATAHFENDIAKMIQFDPALSCKFTKELIGQVPEKSSEKNEAASGEHSEWAANYAVNCLKSPAGSKVTVDFSSIKGLKDLDITILAGTVQKGAEFSGKPVVIDL